MDRDVRDPSIRLKILCKSRLTPNLLYISCENDPSLIRKPNSMSAHALEHLPLDRLRPWPRNARTHSPKQVRQIAASIRRFGFTSPVLIDGENRILAGHSEVDRAQAVRTSPFVT